MTVHVTTMCLIYAAWSVCSARMLPFATHIHDVLNVSIAV